VLDKWGGTQPVFRSDGGGAMKQHRLVWTEEWTTSIAWLDDEHRDLVGYYHAVVDALREDEVDVFLARLRELREWLGLHFKNEESALQQIGCREAYQHREDHQQFIDTLDDFTCNSEKVYGNQERLAVARYIFYWLIRHGKAYDAQIPLHLRHGTAMN
jgi:hemerythrin-like metal-binding protein